MESTVTSNNRLPDTGPIQLQGCLGLVETNGPRARKDRMIPAETVEAIRQTGLFRSFVPTRMGGLGATPQQWLRALIALAERDMGTAWTSGIISVHAFQISLMDNETKQEIYGSSPDTLISSTYNPFGARTQVTEGGVMLSGRWAWSSGCDHCSWVLLGTLVEGRPLIQTMLVPRSDYRIEDTWHVMGLQGTGSKDIVIDEPVFVPNRRIHSQMDGYHAMRDEPGTLYAIPWAQIFAATVAAPQIGAARRALRLFTEKATTSSTDPTKLKGDPDILRRVAEAKALIDGAEETLLRNFTAMVDCLNRGEEIPLLDRVRYRYETGSIATQMMKAIDLLFEVGGGRSVFTGSELQDIWHDIHITRAHVANNPIPLARNYGNMLLGGDNADFFV